ncbi:MAG: AAA family ATPase [Janthinobacterium lividum]
MSQARLIVVAGLPDSGKTTLARHLEQAHVAVRLSADDWMNSLEINLHAEQKRDRIEKLQWQIAQRRPSGTVPTLPNPVLRSEWTTPCPAER